MKKMELYQPTELNLSPYVFYTGKGGVGKTTVASATATHLAKNGYRVTLVSTDPASNLQDVFEVELSNQPKALADLPLLKVANFDPDQAVEDYKESIVGPYRGVLPEEAIENMEEQLSGSCTSEVAQFNEFAFFLTDPDIRQENDYVIFDTAPTGHTLRMLELPSAWTTYFDENTTGTSCMGQLSGLTKERGRYEQAVELLNDPQLTSLYLVTRPQTAAITEANRASQELEDIGIQNQKLVVNGLLEEATDEISRIYRAQQLDDLDQMNETLKDLETYYIPLRPYNVTGLDKLSILLDPEQESHSMESHPEVDQNLPKFDCLVDDLIAQNRQIVFTMGKGGVGKTTVAVQIARALSQRGKNVRLATTDPADHLHLYLSEEEGIEIDHIDEKEEVKKYAEDTLAKSAEFMDEDQLDYVKEDLRSPCTQEIAVFQSFAKIVDKAKKDEIVVIDTAPTGHTILLLESSAAYSREIERSSGDVDPATERLLPRIQSEETEVVMVTLPEATPFYETERLAQDLERAGINHNWWLINQSMMKAGSADPILGARANNEAEWIDHIRQKANNQYVVLAWDPEFENKEQFSSVNEEEDKMEVEKYTLKGTNTMGVVVNTEINGFEYTIDHRSPEGLGIEPAGMILNGIAGCHLMTARTYLADHGEKKGKLKIKIEGEFYKDEVPYFIAHSTIKVSNTDSITAQELEDYLEDGTEIANTLAQGKNKIYKKVEID